MRLKTLLFSGLMTLSSVAFAHHEAAGESTEWAQWLVLGLVVATVGLSSSFSRADSVAKNSDVNLGSRGQD